MATMNSVDALEASEYLVGFAVALAAKSSEHLHYADFENDEVAAAEHRGISQAFGFVAAAIFASTDKEGWGDAA